MTASSRPDMTIEEIAERCQEALADQAAKVRAIREAASAFDLADDNDSYVRAAARNIGALAKNADKAVLAAQAWQGQLRQSLNGAFIRGDLTDQQCRAFLPDWEPSDSICRARDKSAS